MIKIRRYEWAVREYSRKQLENTIEADLEANFIKIEDS